MYQPCDDQAMKLWENPQLQEQVNKWCEANGMNPNVITADPIRVAGEQIEYTAIVVHPDSSPDADLPVSMVDPNNPNSVLKESKSAPLKVEPNAEVRGWLDSFTTV